MDVRRRARIECGELIPGELGEQRVNAIPTPVLQTIEERVGTPEPGEIQLRIVAAERCVAQLGGELTKHRGAQQERSSVLVERGDHLGAQIVGDEAVVTAELTDGFARIIHAAKPQGGEEQRSRPALGPLMQQLDVRRRRSMPSRSTMSSYASAVVKASSLARNSVSLPLARSCASLSVGSVREIMTRRTFAGKSSIA